MASTIGMKHACDSQWKGLNFGESVSQWLTGTKTWDSTASKKCLPDVSPHVVLARAQHSAVVPLAGAVRVACSPAGEVYVRDGVLPDPSSGGVIMSSLVFMLALATFPRGRCQWAQWTRIWGPSTPLLTLRYLSGDGCDVSIITGHQTSPREFAAAETQSRPGILPGSHTPPGPPARTAGLDRWGHLGRETGEFCHGFKLYSYIHIHIFILKYPISRNDEASVHPLMCNFIQLLIWFKFHITKNDTISVSPV